jgi:hypothetical protein
MINKKTAYTKRDILNDLNNLVLGTENKSKEDYIKGIEEIIKMIGEGLK